jgi:hypothetical protein
VETETIGSASAESHQDHGADGRFVGGNKATPRGARDQSSRKFTAWVRAFLEEPGIQEKIRAKVERDLDGDGPGAFAARMIAYGYGEPKQTVEHVAVSEITRLAEEAGVTPEQLIAEAERMTTACEAN